MSSSHPTSGQGAPPTAKQLSTLRSLALSRGQSFAYPATRVAASREIQRLLRAPGSSARDRLIEARQLEDIVGLRDAAAVRQDEITGHGSRARWAGRDGRSAS